ncbi:hypothetical protein HMPREF1092_03340 [Clostridium thermobutyricum]|uniref:Uncharacterized protein n=1 Tax=Clostridium thermobutyricum TaxID=29372 RepID=N9W6A8_9CLOT|nr:hypothetical protein [Clostridium thermobutyricum]ENY98429.1 hypothetical protein HMPREF1092_03340 [Clostridium thermobutyricum]
MKNITKNKLNNISLSILGTFLFIASLLIYPSPYKTKFKNFSPNLEVNLTKNSVILEYLNVPKYAKNSNIRNTEIKYTYSFFSNPIYLEKSKSNNSNNINISNYNIGNLNSNKNNMYRVVCSEKNSKYKMSFNFKTKFQAENFENKFKNLKNKYDIEWSFLKGY